MKLNDFPVREINYMATNLAQNKVYEFRVCAVNKAGNGEYSDPTSPVTPRDPDGRLCYVCMSCYTQQNLK